MIESDDLDAGAWMSAYGTMETLSEQPQRSASGTPDAIHILQAIFQETILRLSRMGSSSFLECLAEPAGLARDNPVYPTVITPAARYPQSALWMARGPGS